MNNFECTKTTKISFGKDAIQQLATEILANAKVLLLYGGGSIKKNGIYNQVIDALSKVEVIEFGGIPANPEYAVLMEALQVIKNENITYLLAVGGGSVIDGTKFLSAATTYKGESPWDILSQNIRTEKGMPFGTVLTLPATGSEMNSGAVITRKETKEKLSMGGPGLFPQFSILDPLVITSIPQRQLANGLTDAFTHVLEQYMTYPIDAFLQDRFAESILQTLIEVAPKILKDPTDYKAASNFMWSCTMALNGLIQKGVPTDWAVHAIGHELTALFGIDHARTLSIVLPAVMKVQKEQKREKLLQYATRVWQITEGEDNARIDQAIELTEQFFTQMQVPTRLSDVNLQRKDVDLVINRLQQHGMTSLGEHNDITLEVSREILLLAL